MKTLYVTTALLLVILTSCSGNKDDFISSGVFESVQILVSAESQGKITELYIEEGSLLKKDQIAGVTDTTQLHLTKIQILDKIRAAQSKRIDVRKQTESLRRQIETAESEKQRFEKLVSADAVNAKQLDDINSQIKILRSQLDALETTYTSANSSLDGEVSALKIQYSLTEDLLRKCILRSPAEGTVLVKYAEEGELASPGKPVFKLADMTNMFLRAYITAEQLTKIKSGDKFIVTADFGDDGVREYEGRITRISDKAEFTPKTIQTKDERANLVYSVKVAVKNDGYLKIGMYGELRNGKK